MTLLAAYLANLAGAAPVEGQKATPASASGAGGLFAALLAATGTEQVTQGEAAPILIPSELPVNPTGEPAATQTSASNGALREALTQGLGLPADGAEIDAAIIESPAKNDAPRINPIVPAALPDADIQIQPSQDGQTPTPDLQQASDEPQLPVETRATVEPQAPAGDASTQDTATPPAAQPGVQTVAEDSAEQAVTRQQPGVPEQAPANETPRQTGLENAANRASQNDQERGLQVTNRTAQPRDAQRPQGESPPTAKQGDNIPLGVKPGDARPQFAARGPEIFKAVVRPGNGQTLIRFQKFSGGDSAIATSPPTLTVNVQANVASPGPASANTPHVPVGALAVHIATQANNGARRFEIRLDPPELGRIEVRLDISRDGQVSTHLVVERSETLELLQRDARQLERALQDAGLDTSKEDIKFSLKDQSLAHGGKDQAEDNEDFSSLTQSDDDDPLDVSRDAMPPPTRYMATTGLDIRI